MIKDISAGTLLINENTGHLNHYFEVRLVIDVKIENGYFIYDILLVSSRFERPTRFKTNENPITWFFTSRTVIYPDGSSRYLKSLK